MKTIRLVNGPYDGVDVQRLGTCDIHMSVHRDSPQGKQASTAKYSELPSGDALFVGYTEWEDLK